MKTQRYHDPVVWFYLFLLTVLMMASCQGTPGDDPPIHLNPNMDSQPKYKSQAESHFFVDKSTMRPVVEGTVPVGYEREDDAYYRGIDSNGEYITSIPIELSMDVLLRGQSQFNVYCSPCHDRTGSGQGMVIKKGFLPPPNFHEQRIVDFADGYYYHVISNGVRNMPSYRHQINVTDRWAIVGYMRALQLSQKATIDDLPEDKKAELIKSHE